MSEYRDYNYEILREIRDRWSPRAISTERISEEDIKGVLEAARFAQSCFNEQPWRYMVAKEGAELEVMREIINEKNRLWAKTAPVLILILSYKNFAYNGNLNRWNEFDTGTSWGFLSLEATRRGLVTHAMGGFDVQKAREKLNVPEDYNIIAVVAMGKLGKVEELALEEFKEKEHPDSRNPLKKMMLDLNYFRQD